MKVYEIRKIEGVVKGRNTWVADFADIGLAKQFLAFLNEGASVSPRWEHYEIFEEERDWDSPDMIETDS